MFGLVIVNNNLFTITNSNAAQVLPGAGNLPGILTRQNKLEALGRTVACVYGFLSPNIQVSFSYHWKETFYEFLSPNIQVSFP